MFSFNRISVKQILVFSETINELSVLQKELIEKRYLENAENFDKTLEFLKQLDLIDIKENRVIPEPDFKPLLVDLKKCQNQYLLIQQFIIEVFINRKNLFSKYTSEFISKFCLLNEKYQFKPNTLERLKYSDLRNFLIDLGFIYLDLNENGENRYVISDDYLYNYIGFKESYEVSLDEFEKIMEKKKEIGVAAELKIIQYEKNRLSEFPYLIEKIEHISIKDVTAGYDIKSFEGKFDDNNNPIPRYIEVKAVSYWDYKFSWTKNEIEKAKFHNQNYYLYLLPVIGKDIFDIQSLKIIRDPYSNLYENESEWIRTIELLTFSLPKKLGEI